MAHCAPSSHLSVLYEIEKVGMVAGKRPRNKAGFSYAIVGAFAAFGLFSLWYWGAPNENFLRQQEEYRRSIDAYEPESGEAGNSEAARIALEYVSAVQTGVCVRAIELTWWMQERLRFVAENSRDEKSAARQELCDSITSRATGGNRLRPEGVEDQYVFAPMAKVEVAALDAGRQDLAKPPMERVWLRVSYPVPTQALHDENGTPIKSLRVGMSLSTDGYVLKAGATGNLEIDFDSISYNW